MTTRDLMSSAAHPIQPIFTDKDGVLRFKKNAIVRYLIDHGSIDMNAIARLPFSPEDHQQLAQLIGYSLSGYGDLSYVDDEAHGAASIMAESPQHQDTARANWLRQELDAIKESLRDPIARLYGIAPEDLARSI